MANVLVVAELLEGKARKTTLCAVTAAKQIAEGTGGSVDILSIGEGAGAAGDELAGYGAGKVLKAEIAGGYVCEKYAATVAEAGQGYDVLNRCKVLHLLLRTCILNCHLFKPISQSLIGLLNLFLGRH